jgi:flagellar motor switch protein FliN/FliY
MSKVLANTNTNATVIQEIELGELPESTGKGRPLLDGNLDIIKDVRVKLDVMVGEAELSIGELYDLRKDSVVKLNRDAEEPVDLVLDGRVVARGTLVVAGDNFGICITEIRP